MPFFLIGRKNEDIAKNRFRTVASPLTRRSALVNAWPSWIDARRQYIFVIISLLLSKQPVIARRLWKSYGTEIKVYETALHSVTAHSVRVARRVISLWCIHQGTLQEFFLRYVVLINTLSVNIVIYKHFKNICLPVAYVYYYKNIIMFVFLVMCETAERHQNKG